MDVRLLDGVFSSTQYPHFFNGRILTATDLKQDRDIHLSRSQYLGQALGDGIVDGLYVTQIDEKLHLQVGRGLAVNRMGDVLHLSNEVILDLTPSQPQISPQDTVFTNESEPRQSAKKLAAFYLLALTYSDTSPSVKQIQTKAQPMGGQSITTHYYEEKHLQFKLIALDELFHPGEQEPKKFRHRLAMACFGIGDWKKYLAKISNVSPEVNLVDTLRHHQLTPLANQDIPIAVLHIQAENIQFVDCWAVRRLCVPQVDMNSPLAGLIATQDKSGAIEHFLQFQEQLENIAQTKKPNDLNRINARDHFDWLPAAGIIPSSVYQIDRFFSGQSIINSDDLKDQPLDASTVKQLMAESCNAGPIKLETDAIEIYRTEWKGQRYIFFARHPSSLGASLTREAFLIKDAFGVSAADYRQGQHRPTLDLRRAINALLNQTFPGTIDIPTELVLASSKIDHHFMLHDTHGGHWLFWIADNILWCRHSPSYLSVEPLLAPVIPVYKPEANISQISWPFALQDSKGEIWVFWTDEKNHFWCSHKSADRYSLWPDNVLKVTRDADLSNGAISANYKSYGTALVDKNDDTWLFWRSNNFWCKYKPKNSEDTWNSINSIKIFDREMIGNPAISFDKNGRMWAFWRTKSDVSRLSVDRLHFKSQLNFESNEEPFLDLTPTASYLSGWKPEENMQAVIDSDNYIWIFFLASKTDQGQRKLIDIHCKKFEISGSQSTVQNVPSPLNSISVLDGGFPILNSGVPTLSFQVLLDKQNTIWVFWINSEKIWCKHKPARSPTQWSAVTAHYVASGYKDLMAGMDINGEIWLSWITRSDRHIFCRSILTYL